MATTARFAPDVDGQNLFRGVLAHTDTVAATGTPGLFVLDRAQLTPDLS